MEEDIVLDRKSFEALAVDSRVRILKSLKQRRKTLSELSDELGMSLSGIKEHLETLERAELIRKLDDGHKWKYYELTKKGSQLLAPKELRVWVLLGISGICLLASLLAVFYAAVLPQGMATAAQENQPPAMLAKANADNGTGQAPVAMAAAIEKTNETLLPCGTQASVDLRIPVAVAAISGATLLACAYLLWRNRRT